jgi:hypothetical protein
MLKSIPFGIVKKISSGYGIYKMKIPLKTIGFFKDSVPTYKKHQCVKGNTLNALAEIS